jgi:phage/plasmid-associated DNA primase
MVLLNTMHNKTKAKAHAHQHVVQVWDDARSDGLLACAAATFADEARESHQHAPSHLVYQTCHTTSQQPFADEARESHQHAP